LDFLLMSEKNSMGIGKEWVGSSRKLRIFDG
jgi:hypothetical protein